MALVLEHPVILKEFSSYSKEMLLTMDVDNLEQKIHGVQSTLHATAFTNLINIHVITFMTS